jgi:hypothetical protein
MFTEKNPQKVPRMPPSLNFGNLPNTASSQLFAQKILFQFNIA